MSTFAFILKNLDHFRGRFVFIFFVTIIDGAATFAITALIAEFTKTDFDFEKYRLLLVWSTLIYGSSVIMQWFIRAYGESLGRQFANHLRLKYFKAIELLPIRSLMQHHSGYVLSLVNSLAEQSVPVIIGLFWGIARAIIHLSLFFIYLARESFVLAFINLGILAFFLIISFYMSQRIVGLAAELNTRQAALMEYYSDFLTNVLTLKRLGIYDFAEKRLQKREARTYNQVYVLQKFHAWRWSVLHSIFFFSFFSTIAYLLYQVVTGNVNLSILILFVSAFFLVRQHLERLSENLKIWMEMKAYVKRLDEIVATGKELDDSSARSAWSTISMIKVRFSHAENKKEISVPDFHIQHGSITCIYGKSGEGKTTVLNLLARVYEPAHGEIALDKTPYREVPFSFFHKNVVLISQEVELFNLSLWDNIALGQNLSQKVVEQYLEELDLLTWVRSLQNGFDTIVGEKGIKLSAGQKQRINLLRGLLLDRELYLLDEPTSHLDAATEAKVIAFLERQLNGKTAVIVSHREPIRRICDASYQLEEHTVKITKANARTRPLSAIGQD